MITREQFEGLKTGDILVIQEIDNVDPYMFCVTSNIGGSTSRVPSVMTNELGSNTDHVLYFKDGAIVSGNFAWAGLGGHVLTGEKAREHWRKLPPLLLEIVARCS